MSFDPMSAEMVVAPYPTYRHLRDEDPVHYSDRFKTWILSRYDATYGAP